MRVKTALLMFIHRSRMRRSYPTPGAKWWERAALALLVLFFLSLIAAAATFNFVWLVIMVGMLTGEALLGLAFLVWRFWSTRGLRAAAAAEINGPPTKEDEAILVLICWELGLAPIGIGIALLFVPHWAQLFVMWGVFVLACICAGVWIRLRTPQRTPS